MPLGFWILLLRGDPEAPRFTVRDSHIVVPLDHFRRGLSFIISDFAHEFLEFCEVQLMHLTIESIPLLTICLHLCDSYLSISPSQDLFSYIIRLEKECVNQSRLISSCRFCLCDHMTVDFFGSPLFPLGDRQDNRLVYACGIPGDPGSNIFRSDCCFSSALARGAGLSPHLSKCKGTILALQTVGLHVIYYIADVTYLVHPVKIDWK
jgi:hypothetical protein